MHRPAALPSSVYNIAVRLVVLIWPFLFKLLNVILNFLISNQVENRFTELLNLKTISAGCSSQIKNHWKDEEMGDVKEVK